MKFGEPDYGITRHVQGGFDEVVERVRGALSKQGFGVLTEIDLSATMKKKLGHDMPAYTILGACHPPSAWKAVSVEPGIGLLLPCNVVVAQDGDRVAVSAVDPGAMFAVVDNPDAETLADEVRQMLEAAVTSL